MPKKIVVKDHIKVKKVGKKSVLIIPVKEHTRKPAKRVK